MLKVHEQNTFLFPLPWMDFEPSLVIVGAVVPQWRPNFPILLIFKGMLKIPFCFNKLNKLPRISVFHDNKCFQIFDHKTFTEKNILDLAEKKNTRPTILELDLWTVPLFK